MITSLLDTDFYTFTQMQITFHKFTGVNVKYAFKWRNLKDMKLKISIKDFHGRLKDCIDKLCELKFTEDELEYLSKIYFFKKDYIEYLRLFKLNRSHIHTSINSDGQLCISIEGPWLNTIMFETPVLAIISQLYSENNGTTKEERNSTGQRKLIEKCDYVLRVLPPNSEFYFSEFGTRRRRSFQWQGEVIKYMMEKLPDHLLGTSNVYYAKKFGITPMGTMSHQYLQAFQVIAPKLEDFQIYALQDWINEYRNYPGFALSDVIGFDAFLTDFERYFALLFDGCRHDSGDPYVWCNKLINHYGKLKINSKCKTALFSDGLDFYRSINLYNACHKNIKTSFGIGTDLTNDCGFIAPQIVIKMVECNGKPVAKISDTPGKGMCENLNYAFKINELIREKVNGG